MTRKLMVRAIYVVYLLLLVEGGARIMFLVPAFSARLAGDHDATWRHRWLERHPTGPGGSHKFEYKFDVHDSTKGWISRPNLRDERVFEGKTLNTNSRGLRGRREYAYGKHPTKPRVLIFGDSFTFGDEVSDDETYAHYLQEMMPEAEIINMGMHGYGHDQMLVFLREEGVKYRPDVVIVGFVTIDMPRNLLAFRDYAKPRFVLTDGRLELTNSPVPSPEELLAWSWLRPRVLDVWSSVAHQIDRERGVLWDKAAAITAAILDGIVAESEKAGAIPIIVHLPTFTEFGVPDGVLTRGEQFLLPYCERRGRARCFSARAFFLERHRQGVAVESQRHWQPAGHRVAAEALHRYLTSQGILTGTGRRPAAHSWALRTAS